MKPLVLLASLLICLPACSDADDKSNNSKSTTGTTGTTNGGGQTTTPFKGCDPGSYEVDSSYVTDDPDDPSGGSRYCLKIPSECGGLANNTNNPSTNNATNSTNNSTTGGSTNNASNNLDDGTTQYCRCLIDNVEDQGFCECADGVVTCSTSG